MFFFCFRQFPTNYLKQKKNFLNGTFYEFVKTCFKTVYV